MALQSNPARSLVASTYNNDLECKPTPNTDTAVSQITSLLTSGKPVVLGIQLSAQFLTPTLPDFLIDGTGTGFGGHAVLVVGLGDITGSSFFLVRNSWGDKWANKGYAWLASDYLADKLIGFAPIVPKI
jgi:C1A family cysteine protease